MILDQRVRIELDDPALEDLFVANFGALKTEDDGCACDLLYRVSPSGQRGLLRLSCCGRLLGEVDTLADLVFAIEKDLILELQYRRPDLFFLHAAAVEWRGSACLFPADSGSGKSTTTFGLLLRGFSYLSDELSPIDLERMEVAPYSHAICLKRPPPLPYMFPAGTVRLGSTNHVPVNLLPCGIADAPRHVGAAFLLHHDPLLGAPELRRLTIAEAAARLYVNALNVLAHPNQGLDAALRMALQVPCFALHSADLSQTCELVQTTIEHILLDTSKAQ